MSFKFTVEVTPAELKIPDSSEAKAVERYLKANLRQIDQRLDARGQKFPEGVTLKDTERLVTNTHFDATSYYFDQPYAEYVEDRFHFIGLSPIFQEEADREVSAIWDTEPLEIIDR